MKITADSIKNFVRNVLILLMIVVLIRQFNLTQHFESMLDWIKGLGVWSIPFYIGLFVLTAGILLPMPLLMMSSGVMYGVVGGTMVIVAACVIEGALLYLIARKFERKIAGAKIMQNKYSHSIQSLLAEEGYKMIALLRCLPYMSFVFLSFICGISKVSLRNFLTGTLLGMVPVSLAYSYLGYVTNTAISGATGSSGVEQSLRYGGLLIAIIITIYVTYRAKQHLDLDSNIKVA